MFPRKQVQLAAGESVTGVDFSFTPGFLTGRLLHPNSGALPYLYYAETTFQRYARPTKFLAQLLYEGVDQNYASTPPRNSRPAFANQYWAFAITGLWQMTQLQLKFQSNSVDGLAFYSSMHIYDYQQGGQYAWNVPAQRVEEDATTEYNLDYKTGIIRVRMRVADGRPVSNPQLGGEYRYIVSGPPSKLVYLEGSANAINVTEGMAQLYALPGTVSTHRKSERQWLNYRHWSSIPCHDWPR